ncbi:MAG TPA: hypothetical protein VFE53_02365 [Mucilaginibacter sp.]|jgi:hypothetical protein|nr:hypothetical protein [Mucilaginibacter sp.]
MALFSTDFDKTFDLADLERQHNPVKKTKRRRADLSEEEAMEQEVFGASRDPEDAAGKTQFTIFQFGDGEQRLQQTTQIQPKLKGDTKPDINLSLDFEAFRLSANDRPEDGDRATLQLSMGQEKRLSAYDKLVYCINGGLDLLNQFENHKEKTRAEEFRQSADTAMGNKPIALPGGQGKLSFNVVKHIEPAWWQKIFQFAGSSAGKQLLSLVGFGGITEAAFSQVGKMLEVLFEKQKTETLFSSDPIRIAFTQSARDDIAGGGSYSKVSCLNPGIWILARSQEYHEILDQKPIYFPGYGLLAPEGMEENEIVNNKSNPFSAYTYAVIRARIKETSFKQDD